MEQLFVAGKMVLLIHLPRVYNIADSMARQAMRCRRGEGWPTDGRIERIDSAPQLRDAILLVEQYTLALDEAGFRALRYGNQK